MSVELGILTNKIIDHSWAIKDTDRYCRATFQSLDDGVLTINLINGPIIRKTAIEVFREGYVNGQSELKMLRTIYEKDLLLLLLDNNQEEYMLYRVLFANGCYNIKSITHQGFVFSKFLYIDNKIVFLYTGSTKTGIAPIIEEKSLEVFVSDVYAATGEKALRDKMKDLVEKINNKKTFVKTDDEILNIFLNQNEDGFATDKDGNVLCELELLTYNNMLKENITKIIA